MIQSEKCREKKRKERRKEETRKEKKPKRKQKKNPQRKSITNGEESRAQRSLRKGISIPLRFSLSFSSPFPPLVRFALIPFPFFSAFHSSSPAAHDCPRLPPTKQISFVLNNIMSWDFLSSFSNFLFSFFFFSSPFPYAFVIISHDFCCFVCGLSWESSSNYGITHTVLGDFKGDSSRD